MTVVTTANAIGRKLAGQKELSIGEIDLGDNANLISGRDLGGVEVCVRVADQGGVWSSDLPVAFCDGEVADRGASSRVSMETVVVRPDMFQEFRLLSPAAGFRLAEREVRIFGKGDAKAAYVALDDVAEAVVRLALAEEPPNLVEFGGQEKLTRNEAADLFEERATGRSMSRSHVPRAVLRAGALVLRSILARSRRRDGDGLRRRPRGCNLVG